MTNHRFLSKVVDIKKNDETKEQKKAAEVAKAEVLGKQREEN